MKKNLITCAAIVVAIFSVVVTSCKKDNSKATAAKIVGKWIVKTVITHETNHGVTLHDTIIHTDNYDSYLFRADGSTLIKESDTEQNIGWKISDNKLVLGVTTAFGNAEIFDINTLTNTDLQLHQVYSTTDYALDRTITLNKEG